MHADHEPRESGLEDGVRLIVVSSPDMAAPLIDALEIADTGAWMWVEQERALYLSPRVLDLLGLTSVPHAELLARFLAGVHHDELPLVRRLVRGEFDAGRFELRYRFTPPDGPLRWIEDRGSVERAPDGALIRQGGAIRDATREIGRELEQREADARLEALVNAMPIAVWGRSGPDLTVTHQNQASIASWGDLRGSPLADAPLDVRELWRAQIAAVMTGQIVRARREHLEDGDRRILHDIIAPVVVEDRVVGVVGLALDVTDEERARVRQQDAHKLESLGVLAGGIAHDFNNLLTAILGNASLLQMEYGNSLAMAGPLEQIEAAARRAAELCRQMLAYAGRGRFSLQPLDLNDLVRDMEDLMSLTLPPNAALELLLASQLPPILGDDSQLRQLVTNLVSNAAEALHGQGGTITVRTTHSHRSAKELSTTVFAPDLQDGDYVSLSVSDTGEGMTAETLSRIFDPFFSTRFTGRGLGLASVVGIVRAHKGALRVESALGSGAMFELLLPAQHSLTVRAAQPRHAAGADESTPLSGTVLVVDDEVGVRSIARTVLERDGLTVVLAEDGERGVELFRQDPQSFKAVVVDLTMPVMDGRETLQKIFAIRSDVPAILMSGYTPTDFDSPLPHEFLQKPFTPSALRAAIRRVLHGR